MNQSEPTVPCKWCGQPTAMLATITCHGCWELESRIFRDPELSKRILRSQPTPQSVRVRRYLLMREEQPIRGSDDVIHAIHLGTDYAAELRLSDLQTIMGVKPTA